MALIKELVEWRNAKARQFVFDPSRVPSGPPQATIIKYRQLQQICEARLVSGAAELSQIRSSAQAELPDIGREIVTLVPQIWQADADAIVF